MSLIAELKQRNVFRVGIAYVVLGWAVLQGADFLLELVDAPEWTIRVFAVAGLVGFPFALFFAWACELTPEGIKPEREVDRTVSLTPQTGRKLDRLIILFLAVAVSAAQLTRAGDGFHLWSQNYDSASQDTIEVREDIAEQIATALDVVPDERRRARSSTSR